MAQEQNRHQNKEQGWQMLDIQGPLDWGWKSRLQQDLPD
jgi:hypothetical protein